VLPYPFAGLQVPEEIGITDDGQEMKERHGKDRHD
jgi:hypothetical protein